MGMEFLMGFVLDKRLAADIVVICQLELSVVGLMCDARYPWLVVVPKKAGLVEVTDLDVAGRKLLWGEVEKCCMVVQAVFPDAKLNIGALGNIVRQLHVHIIARHQGDAAWPGPVWGMGEAEPYEKEALTEQLDKFKQAFQALP